MIAELIIDNAKDKEIIFWGGGITLNYSGSGTKEKNKICYFLIGKCKKKFKSRTYYNIVRKK